MKTLNRRLSIFLFVLFSSAACGPQTAIFGMSRQSVRNACVPNNYALSALLYLECGEDLRVSDLPGPKPCWAYVDELRNGTLNREVTYDRYGHPDTGIRYTMREDGQVATAEFGEPIFSAPMQLAYAYDDDARLSTITLDEQRVHFEWAGGELTRARFEDASEVYVYEDNVVSSYFDEAEERLLHKRKFYDDEGRLIRVERVLRGVAYDYHYDDDEDIRITSSDLGDERSGVSLWEEKTYDFEGGRLVSSETISDRPDLNQRMTYTYCD